MATRYATILTTDEGEEEISTIAQLEGAVTQPRSDARIIKASDGWKIGMIKGGPVDSVDGYGFRAGTTPAAKPAGGQPDREEPAPKRGRPKASAKADVSDVDA